MCSPPPNTTPLAGGCAVRASRRLMSDASLLRELLRRLGSGHPPLMQGCLALLDVLASEEPAAGVLLGERWMGCVVPLLASGDGGVRRGAERALCSLFMAVGGAGGEEPEGGRGA